jgi:hypothetical protein
LKSLVYSQRKAEKATSISWFYQIHTSSNAGLKRDGGFPTQDAAKTAGREDVKKKKNTRQPDTLDIWRIKVG